MKTDIEEILRKADFTAGSEHKSRLYKELFNKGGNMEDKNLKGMVDNRLSDDDLDAAAGGLGIYEATVAKKLPNVAKKAKASKLKNAATPGTTKKEFSGGPSGEFNPGPGIKC